MRARLEGRQELNVRVQQELALPTKKEAETVNSLFVPDHRYAYWHAVAVHAFRRLG